jgi:hypothetical protein
MSQMKTSVPRLVLVGGFLGAGKTTLIVRAAKMLAGQGRRAAVILNDQGRELVDTEFARASELEASEVAGGCFCCRFSEFIEAAEELRRFSPDVIFAEPVGSCVDLSATILQPLKAWHEDRYRTAPLTVLVCSDLARRVFCGEADDDVAYLFKNQLAEADVVCLSKSDLGHETAELPFPVDFRLSAKTGDGVEEWLRAVLDGGRVAGAKILEVDYGRYGEAEAALGWLNLHAQASLVPGASPAEFAGPLLERIDEVLSEENIQIAHLKVFDRAGAAYVKASICANGDEPTVDGDLLADARREHELAVNLRALGDPARLEEIVRGVLAEVAGEVRVGHASAFRPAQPVPEYRLGS